MHIQTHVLSGWCISNLFTLTPKERLFCMVAAAAADVDGLGLLVSQDYYVAYHHVLAHNLLFGVLLSAVLTWLSIHRAKAFCLYLALFHLHLVLDYFGSGPGWGIYYLWPLSMVEILNPNAWNFFSWQNLSAFGFFLLWTLVIIWRGQRTPLECIMPSLDGKIVRVCNRRCPT